MKKPGHDKKLTLSKDIVRALDQVDLTKAAGGNVTSTVQKSNVFNHC